MKLGRPPKQIEGILDPNMDKCDDNTNNSYQLCDPSVLNWYLIKMSQNCKTGLNRVYGHAQRMNFETKPTLSVQILLITIA